LSFGEACCIGQGGLGEVDPTRRVSLAQMRLFSDPTCSSHITTKFHAPLHNDSLVMNHDGLKMDFYKILDEKSFRINDRLL
jgi:hypothetical protein